MTAGSASAAIGGVFGSDEQAELDIDVLRWIDLARLVLREERVPVDAEVSVIFVDVRAITDLNERFLGGDGPTDVLAFPMDGDVVPPGRQPDQGGRGPGTVGDAGEPPSVLGDVVVCPAVAGAQAAERGRTLDDEIALLVVHGLLHLLDYDHAEEAEAEAMQRREAELLELFHRSGPRGPG